MMLEVSVQTLMMSVQAVAAEIAGIKESVAGDLGELEPDMQELMLSYSKAAMELKARYLDARKSAPSLPPYEQLVSNS
jgi:hypothetical protein